MFVRFEPVGNLFAVAIVGRVSSIWLESLQIETLRNPAQYKLKLVETE